MSLRGRETQSMTLRRGASTCLKRCLRSSTLFRASTATLQTRLSISAHRTSAALFYHAPPCCNRCVRICLLPPLVAHSRPQWFTIIHSAPPRRAINRHKHVTQWVRFLTCSLCAPCCCAPAATNACVQVQHGRACSSEILLIWRVGCCRRRRSSKRYRRRCRSTIAGWGRCDRQPP